MVWDPSRVTARSWKEVVEFYRHLEERNHDFSPMRALAEHIQRMPAASTLLAATSGTSLLVKRTAVGGWLSEGARIDVHFDGTIRLFVQARSPGPPKASRCEADAIVAGFEQLLVEAYGA